MSERERKCTYCETWTRGWIAVCSDCHGERTDALCRRKRAERQVAAVRKALDEMLEYSRDYDGKTRPSPLAPGMRYSVQVIGAALETE